MFKKRIVFELVCITGFLFSFLSCIQTNTLTTDFQRSSTFKNPAYIGTFSSISILKNADDSTYYNLASTYFNYRYDSIIKARVTKMRRVEMIGKLDKPVIEKLSKELVTVITDSKKNNGLVNQIPRNTMDSIASLFPERYSSYFVCYGNILAPDDFKDYKLGKAVVTGLVVAATIVVSVALAAIFKSNTSSTNLNVNDADEKFQDGVFCYLIIYDKEKKQVSMLRKQYFKSDKKNNQPFHPKKINKQINVIFKEYLK